MKIALLLIILFFPILAFAQTSSQYFESGKEKANNNDYKGAISDFTSAIALNPKDTASYNWRANTKEELHDVKGAVDDYSASIKIAPGLKAYLNRASIENRLHLMYDAIADCNKAISMTPDESFSYKTRGCAYMLLDNVALGLNDFNKAISVNANDADAYVFRGRVFAMQHNGDKAMADFRKAIQLKPSFAEAFERLASTEYSIGKRTEACADWEKAKALGSTLAANELSQYCK